MSSVPDYGCGCQDFLSDYLLANPPQFDDFWQWGVDLHNAVNLKLKKPFWSPVDSVH